MNPLDRLFTWGAGTLPFRKWCQTPEHWTAKVSAYLFTDCPCCLVFRGATIGIALGAVVAGPLGFAIGKFF